MISCQHFNGVYLFDLRGFHPRHLRLRPTIIVTDIRDFHPYSLVCNSIWNLVVEPLPSTQVPYGLRNTLGYLDA